MDEIKEYILEVKDGIIASIRRLTWTEEKFENEFPNKPTSVKEIKKMVLAEVRTLIADLYGMEELVGELLQCETVTEAHQSLLKHELEMQPKGGEFSG